MCCLSRYYEALCGWAWLGDGGRWQPVRLPTGLPATAWIAGVQLPQRGLPHDRRVGPRRHEHPPATASPGRTHPARTWPPRSSSSCTARNSAASLLVVNGDGYHMGCSARNSSPAGQEGHLRHALGNPRLVPALHARRTTRVPASGQARHDDYIQHLSVALVIGATREASCTTRCSMARDGARRSESPSCTSSEARGGRRRMHRPCHQCSRPHRSRGHRRIGAESGVAVCRAKEHAQPP